MPLTPKELGDLLDATLTTREVEIGCDDTLMSVGAYAEAQLARLELPEALRLVKEHLDCCRYCREELRMLLDALGGED
jgi:hypothetical protein